MVVFKCQKLQVETQPWVKISIKCTLSLKYVYVSSFKLMALFHEM